MNLFQRTARAAAFVACLGTVLPSAIWADGPRQTPAPPAKAAAKKAPAEVKKAAPAEVKKAGPVDVALNKSGTLQGSVLASDGKPLDGSLVTLRDGDSVIATTTSDVRGQYALNNLKGGVYQLTAGQQTAVVRVWPSESAPPTALNHAVMVAPTVRAQDGYEEGGGAGGLDIVSLLTLGTAGGALVVGVVNHNDIRHIKGKIDKLVTP